MAVGERILLTGGSGFIGSEVVQIALEHGLVVRNLDIRAPRISQHRDLWRKTDVRDAESLRREIVDFVPDRVLHLASDIDVNLKELEEYRTTIEGTRNILSALRDIPGLKRFVHTSTQFVVMPGVEPKHERFLKPYTVYGEAKAETEKLVWQAALKVPWFILRPTIIWGPHHPSFAQQIFKHIANGTYLHPRASEPIYRAYGYVTNTARQMFQFVMLDPNQTERHVFYLGDGSLDYELWADAFAVGMTGKRAKRIPVALLTFLGWLGDLTKVIGIKPPIDSGRAFRMSTASSLDIEPTFALLGQPQVSFEAGVAETLKWLKEVS